MLLSTSLQLKPLITVCLMCAHNDAKMQKHSLQPHNDATDGK